MLQREKADSTLERFKMLEELDRTVRQERKKIQRLRALVYAREGAGS